MKWLGSVARGGLVLGTSLGLASLGSGVGLVASHSSTSATTIPSNGSATANPNLICKPGGGCGTPQYFENQKTVDNYTAYNRVEYIGSRTAAGVVGCVAGVAALGVIFYLNPATMVTWVTGPVVWQAACTAGAGLFGWIASLFVIPPQMRANLSGMHSLQSQP